MLRLPANLFFLNEKCHRWTVSILNIIKITCSALTYHFTLLFNNIFHLLDSFQMVKQNEREVKLCTQYKMSIRYLMLCLNPVWRKIKDSYFVLRRTQEMLNTNGMVNKLENMLETTILPQERARQSDP